MEPSLARRSRRSSHDLPSRLRRALFLIHRWLGVALALVMVLWAASGIVMMYVAYPATSPEERMAGLEPLDMARCCAALPPLDGLEGAAIEMLDGRPVLRVATAAGPTTIDLRTGRPFPAVDARLAERIARTHLARSTGAAPAWTARATAQDQWTVSGEFRAHAPLYKATADDEAGTVLYISGVTGQVVQDTTRSERFWNWLGAIPHWLYFKQLRANGPLWSQVVIYASLLGAFLTAIGLYIGVIRLGRGKRWSPYRGMGWWHHVTGLAFGILTLTWVASGLFSMNPWGLMTSEGPGAELTALAGRPATPEDARALVQALTAAPASGAVRAELSIQGGEAYAIVSEPSGLRWRASLPLLAPAPLRHQELDALAGRALPAKVSSAGLIRAEDAYHYAHHDSVVLPVWRVIYADRDRTRLYFDPLTGELVDYVDGPARAYRWWHSALHSFDFAPELRSRPVWDIVVLPLMAGVTILCLIGLWLGIRRLSHTIQKAEKMNNVWAIPLRGSVMKKTYVCMLAMALLAAGCSKEEKKTEPAKAAPTTIHEFMTQRIDPDADAIWAIGNAAISEDASIDPALMSDQNWTDLKAAADRMAGHARALENLDPVVVVKPGMKIADEGTQGAPTPAMIQAHLEKDTDVFRALADSLTTHATDLSAAAAAKDAATAGRLINEMDGVCESCHLEFWYPEQKELMKKMGLLPG